MLVTSLSIVGYLLFIDSPPSFLRAVTMFIVGFILFDRNLLKADFQTLIYASILLLSIFPSLFFSVGFWFSVAGVFYIFLFLQIANYLKLHFLIQMVALNIWVFSAMLPITHSIFPEFYLTQLYSPIWTILFSFIYPLMILLHLVQFPTLFDDILKLFFSIESGEVYNFQTPIYFLILYIFLPIIGILLYNFRDKLKFNKG
jgi:competence protein ComEC